MIKISEKTHTMATKMLIVYVTCGTSEVSPSYGVHS